jgi:hypothetical protein
MDLEFSTLLNPASPAEALSSLAQQPVGVLGAN